MSADQELFKAIFKLEGDSTQLLSELDKVNAKYKEQNEELKKQQINLKTLQDREVELTKGRAAAQNPTQIAKYNKVLDENRAKINEVKKAIENLTVTDQKATKATDDLGKKMAVAFDATKVNAVKTEVEALNKKINASEAPVKSLRTQLKDLKAQLAATDDDEEFLKLSVEAGKLQDKIDDASQAARIFATGTPFQAFSNGLRGVAGDLLNMDFEGAAQKSQLLVKASQQITFKGSLEGIKQLGTTLLNTGKALLSNPIFLIGAAVALIISNFDKLTKMGGLVGKFFGGISDSITFIIDGLVKFTDAIGLTQTALEKFDTFRQEQFERNTKRQLDDFDRQIKLAQALGKITDEIEKAKQRAIIRTAELELRPMEAVIEQSKKGSFILQKEFADRYEELKKIVADANTEIEIIDINAGKRQIENAKKREDELKSLRVKAVDADNYTSLAQQKLDFISKIEKEGEERRKAQQEKERAEQLAHNQILRDMTKQRYDEENKALIEQEEKTKAIRQEIINAQLAGIQSVTNATINASQQVVSAKIAEIDQLRSLQQQRVNDSREIADKGNAELFELEQKRLDDLNQQRAQFVKQQQALASLELVANTAVAVSKAAAQGGVAAPFTIAVALIALAAGLAQARSISSQAAYYEGGYTGDGNPRSESKAVGPRPYIYHKGEFVMDHEKTAKYRDIFEGIHNGHINLHDWKNKVQAFESQRMLPVSGPDFDVSGLQKEMVMLRMAVEGQSTSINMDENGLNARFKNITTRSEYIKNNLARA